MPGAPRICWLCPGSAKLRLRRWPAPASMVTLGAAKLHARAALLLLDAGGRALIQGALGSATQTLSAARSELRRAKSPDPTLAADIDEALVKALALTADFERLAPIVEEAVGRLEAARTEPRRPAPTLLMAD